MAKLFNSSGYLEPGYLMSSSQDEVNFLALPPFLRVLLTADGTVTKSLESYFWEPVDVQKKVQQEVVLKDALPFLLLQRGDRVICREVELVGRSTGVNYTRAMSYICLKKLPAPLREQLINGSIGIGELLRECGLETYRDIADYGVVNDAGGVKEVWRTYVIVLNELPVIQITESFPLSSYV